MKVKSESEVTQSCTTLRDPLDCSPPGSSVHGILQARVLEWGAIAFSTREERHCLFGATGVRFRELLKKTLDLKGGELHGVAEGKRWVVEDVTKIEEWFSWGE